MSEPEIGDNSTREILKELRTFTKEIRDLLLQKAVQDKGEDLPEVPDATLSIETANVETDNSDTWPNDEIIARYRKRCAKHKSECEKMHVELGCFIAHLDIVGGNKVEIDRAESLRKVLLDPVQCLEKAFDATPDGRPNVMDELRMSFSSVDAFVSVFAYSPHEKDSLYLDKVKQWRRFTYNGWRKFDDFVSNGEFVECLEFIHDVFFSELEMAMGGVVEALKTFEEKTASEWLKKQKIVDFESWSQEYISRVFSPLELVGATSASPDSHTVALLKGRLPYYQSVCAKMGSELDHLIAHYGVVGGDKEVIEAAKLVQSCLLGIAEELKDIVTAASDERLIEMSSLFSSLGKLYLAASKFKGSLYHQKHAFYFREVKKWVDCLLNGLHVVHSCLRRNELIECLTYACKELFTDLEVVMIGLSTVPETTKLREEILPGPSSSNVAEELKMFGKESLPKFLVDQMERDTTRYVNLTTIATFFSSVTATTLQFTYAATDSVPSNSLRGIVNLFWFLSLVFSVSSGVNSLLGLTWRKSSIYDSRVSPKLIRMWFEKAPMLFLIIAAVAFVIGLNLFAYLSLQPRYVSFATTILTGVHGVCLLAVTAWFIYQLKHESIWAGWVRTAMKPITTITEWMGTGVKWIWKLVKRPYKKYKENLHLQRNIFWAFGIDNRVVRINCDTIYWGLDLPRPHLLSKLIRCIVYPIKRCWLMTKKAISDISCTVRAHICVLSPTGRTGDVEMGEILGREDVEVPVETSSPDKKAKDEFRKSLQKVFSNADWVMSNIEYWEYETEGTELNYLEKILWGYPSLVEKFDAVVRPALAEAREKRRRERERVYQQYTATENDAIRSLIPEVAGQDTDNTTPVPPQLSQTTPLDDEPGRSDITQTDVRPDSQGQQVNNHPPTPDERALLTASGNTEVLEPTSGHPIPMPDREGGATSPNEIEEVLFTLEGSRIAQSKEESGE